MGYQVRRVGDYELLLDDENGRGRVVILALADGRAWTYCWPLKNRGSRGGGDLWAWLCDSDIGYVAGKMGAGDWFDADATVSLLREYLVQWRRDGHLTREAARAIWNSLDDIQSESDWSAWLGINDQEEGERHVTDAWEYRSTGILPEFRAAFNALWDARLVEVA